MKAIGFNFHKGRIRVAVLELSGGKPTFLSRKLVDVDPSLPLPELTHRYITNLRGLLDEAPTELVAVRLVYESASLDAARSQVMPAGLLALICHEKGRKLLEYTPQALRSGKSFALDRAKKPIKEVDNLFGDHPPHWDDLHRAALLVAWRALLENS